MADLFGAYASAYRKAKDPMTSNRGTVAAKNDARRALRQEIGMLNSVIQSQSQVTDQQKLDLGLTVRKQPTPGPVPATWPTLSVLGGYGRTVYLRLIAAGTERRGRPELTAGAFVFYHISDAEPTAEAEWSFGAVTGRTEVTITLPGDTPRGACVWFRACWFNGRKQAGPHCPPVAVSIAGGGSSVEAA